MMTTFALITMQILISAQAGFVNFVQGATSVTLHQQVPAGTPIETDRGYAELLLNPGTLLRVGQNSKVVLDSTDLSDVRVHVTQGEALIESSNLDKKMPIHVRSGNLDTLIVATGLYRFSGDTATVFDGRLQAADHSATAKQGTQLTYVAGKDQVLPMDANFRYDNLDMWSQARANVLSKANTLALYGSSTGSYFPYTSAYPAVGYGAFGAGWMYSPFLNGYTFIPAYGGYQSYYGYPYYGAPAFMNQYVPPMAAAPASATNRGNRPPAPVVTPNRPASSTNNSSNSVASRPSTPSGPSGGGGSSAPVASRPAAPARASARP